MVSGREINTIRNFLPIDLHKLKPLRVYFFRDP